jgi:hypothetical protein
MRIVKNKYIFVIVFLCIYNRAFSADYGFVSSPEGLRVRIQPNRISQVLLLLPYKSLVIIEEQLTLFETIDGINSNWLKISINQRVGYVFGGFINRQTISKNALIDKSNKLLKKSSPTSRIDKFILYGYGSTPIDKENMTYEEIIAFINNPISCNLEKTSNPSNPMQELYKETIDFENVIVEFILYGWNNNSTKVSEPDIKVIRSKPFKEYLFGIKVGMPINEFVKRMSLDEEVDEKRTIIDYQSKNSFISSGITILIKNGLIESIHWPFYILS